MHLAMPHLPARADAGDLLSTLAGWARRQPLEASAIVLLGLGGAIFPPVWLLGAVVALTSRLWDYRDKWLGLALPVLVTVVATVVGIAMGGAHGVGHGVHEGWVFAEIVSRVSAALSAAYLGWRSAHGRRPPAVPPWNKPHNVS
jgi:fatty acid desaturase